jgi:hypothetical protein
MAIMKSTPEVISRMLAESMRNVYKQALREEMNKVFKEELEKSIEEKTKDLVARTNIYQNYGGPSIHVEVQING